MLFTYSCEIISKYDDCNDEIKSSLQQYTFNTNGGTVAITIKNSRWKMESMYINNREITYPIDCNYDFTEYPDYPIVITCSILPNSHYNEPTLIKGQWFTLLKEESQTLTIIVTPNEIGETRWLQVNLVAGDCVTSVEITQLAQ